MPRCRGSPVQGTGFPGDRLPWRERKQCAGSEGLWRLLLFGWGALDVAAIAGVAGAPGPRGPEGGSRAAPARRGIRAPGSPAIPDGRLGASEGAELSLREGTLAEMGRRT